ncbi:MAG: hypothetical protein UY96_C0034G0007 [Parcubacteria group bacterium GW2011_GWB1_56_8]|nr:MAG: hypothetical protein UY96_C0034G0007 [Parcubacteria group bacterium GW2011_GWB1_56_8]
MIPEGCKPVQLAHPQTSNGGFDSDWISLKNAIKAFIVVEMNQAVGHATKLTVNQATVVAGSDTKVLTNTTRIWANEDVAASDALVRKTAAKDYTVTNDIKKKQVVFEINPADCLDVANAFDCVGVNVADSSQATDFVSITAFLMMKYAEATPPSAIVD